MTPDMEMQNILVGVDGSAASMQAVDWAGRVASGETLTVCFVSPTAPTAGLPMDPMLEQELYDRGAAAVAHARTRAHAAVADLRSSSEICRGNAAQELLRLAAGSSMAVLGSHGTGWFQHMQLGSTAAQVAAYARCPVVLVRRPRSRNGPVVVGLDAAQDAHEALRFGFLVAERTGCDLLAVHALDLGHAVPPDRVAELRSVAAGTFKSLIGPWAEKHPAVAARVDTMRDGPARVLAEASRRASMIVVSARGVGGFPSLRLGSVSTHVLDLAGCPVAVVH